MHEVRRIQHDGKAKKLGKPPILSSVFTKIQIVDTPKSLQTRIDIGIANDGL